mmetsp:Transcript_94962/g.271507  ORF Transcript_94962/g.271507 Transcript_94962/m.271507 type:complete len:267 (+) Transcript_94962:533-1333(+)
MRDGPVAQSVPKPPLKCLVLHGQRTRRAPLGVRVGVGRVIEAGVRREEVGVAVKAPRVVAAVNGQAQMQVREASAAASVAAEPAGSLGEGAQGVDAVYRIRREQPEHAVRRVLLVDRPEHHLEQRRVLVTLRHLEHQHHLLPLEHPAVLRDHGVVQRLHHVDKQVADLPGEDRHHKHDLVHQPGADRRVVRGEGPRRDAGRDLRRLLVEEAAPFDRREGGVVGPGTAEDAPRVEQHDVELAWRGATSAAIAAATAPIHRHDRHPSP